jgi:fatty acid desaturase
MVLADARHARVIAVLHHLFPLVDAGHLPRLYPVLKQTCFEYGVAMDALVLSPWDAMRGFFRQVRGRPPRLKSTVLADD